ncbi:hypothetical protein B7R54_15115 [Subtercola boreus]|uniref:Uncharacterized protein n=1 Tax=Subtercola boreus TaxID=120213 RepID=A0A3E0VKH7_9MICO|nr:hypothetical protein [Subtercola boreus]RFA10386.1 hypothetical protein B7R54_15115 [Subtercola boreus]TQL56097.1 hypothetical protein FB464_3679 [Subtercola boreus]
MGRDWIRLRVIFLAVAGLFGLTLFAVTTLQLSVDGHTFTVLAAAVIVAGALTAYWAISFRSYIRKSELPSKHLRESPSQIPLDEVEKLASSDGTMVIEGQHVLLYVGCLVTPKQHFSRISEHVESYHRSILVRSTFNLKMQGAEFTQSKSDSTSQLALLIPLLLPKKGSLQDGLKITDGNGKRIPTVDSHSQYVYAAAVLRFLVGLMSTVALDEYLGNGRRLENRVWAVIVADKPSTKEVDELVQDLSRLPVDPHLEVLMKLFVGVIQELANFHPISIAVPVAVASEVKWPASTRYVLERRFIPETEPPPDNNIGRIQRSLFFDSVRLAFGVRINRIYFPLTSAYRTRSYHLEVEGRDGTFFAGEEFIAPHLEPGEKLQFGGGRQPRQGQRRSHVYMKSVTGKSGMYYAARFFERAPGSFAGLTIASIVSTTVVAVLWAVHATDLATEGTFQTSGFIPALLTVPIAMSAFLGLDSDNSKRHPSLASRVVSFGVIVISLGAFVVSLLESGEIDVPTIVWHSLLWASVAVTLGSLLSWTLRLAVENHFVREQNG